MDLKTFQVNFLGIGGIGLHSVRHLDSLIVYNNPIIIHNGISYFRRSISPVRYTTMFEYEECGVPYILED